MPDSQQERQGDAAARGTGHSVIAIEGIDGCGKTIVGKSLAGAVGGRYYATPPRPYRKIRKYIDCADSRLEHFLFYVAALLRASREIEDLAKVEPVVVDRYVASTVAYHSPWLDGALEIMKGLPLILPAATVLLSAHEDIRRARLERRDGNRTDSWFDTAAALRRAEAVLHTFATFEVDTTDKSVSEVVARIIGELGERGVLR